MVVLDAFSQPIGQGWGQVGALALAFALSSLIGVEREARQRSAGLRTYTLVGLGAALFMLVSKHAFWDILDSGTVMLDPSRVAAQVVSGIGFIGGGLIFVRRDAVRGLTTAAAVWVTAAVGMACGGGLPILAGATTAGYMVVVFAYTPLVRRLPGGRFAAGQLRIEYVDRRGLLRRALELCSRQGFTISELSVVRGAGDDAETPAGSSAVVAVTLTVRGPRPVTELVAALSDLDDVVAVSAGDPAAE